MAHINFNPVPDVAPRPAPPADYQEIPTNPREFGAQVGAGEERLGAGVTAAGKQFGEIAADEQVNHVLTGLDDLTTQYQSLKGRDALDQQQTIRKAMADVLAKARGNLSTLDQQLDFDRQTRYLYSRADREVGAHADQQQQVWGLGVNKSAADLALNGAARAAASGDIDAAANFTADAVNARMKAAQLTYGMDLSPEIRANVEREARAESARGQIMGMLPTNPAGAKQILDANAQNFTGLEYETLSQHLKTGVTDQEAQQFVMGSPGPGQPGEWRARPGQQVANANPDEQRFLNEARHRESGGNYEAVNPSSGTTGAFQFKDQTWKEASAATGVGTEFAHAKDAPPSVQDANALWLYRNRGAQPWAASGPYPAAAQSAHLTANSPNVTPDDRQTPGLSNEIDRIYSSNLTPQAKDKAAELARLKYTSEWTDQTRAHELQQRQQKDASDAAENQIIADAASPTPQITAQQIANNPALTPEAKLRMMNVIQSKTVNDAEHAKAAYGPGFWDAYKGVTAAPGDPSRIVDQADIIRRAGPGGDLTLAGVKELTATMNAMKRPEAAGDTKLQAGALAYAKHQLSFEADYGFGVKTRDPKGEDAFNVGFLPAFMNYWQQGTAAGETPSQLVDQKRLDNLIAPYKRPPAELMKDQLQAGTEATATAATPAGPPAAAVAYLKTNPALRNAFDQKYGAGMADKVLGPAGPEPPIAH